MVHNGTTSLDQRDISDITDMNKDGAMIFKDDNSDEEIEGKGRQSARLTTQ